MYKILSVSFVVATLCSACGLYTDRSEDYKKTGSIKPVTLPEGQAHLPMGQLFEIPEIPERPLDEFGYNEDGEVPRPLAMSQESEKGRVKIQSVGGRRWVLLEAPASQVWPLAQSFLSSAGISTVKTNPRTGLVETDWLVFKADESKKNRFQIRIEKGIRNETTEVHILHDEIVANDNGAMSAWPKASDSAELERWLIDEMSQSLLQQIDNRAASLQGQSIGGRVKANLKMQNGEPVIRLDLDQDRALATVVHSLKKEGLVLWGKKEESNLFLIGYNDPANQPGWFKRKFTGDNLLPETPPHDIDKLLSRLSEKDEVKVFFRGVQGVGFAPALNEAMGYFVKLSPITEELYGEGYVVQIRDHRGRQLPIKQAKRLMALIRRNLI